MAKPNPVRARDMLSELRAQVEGLERILPELIARQDGTNEEYAAWKEHTLHKICTAIVSYGLGDDSNKAVAILSRMYNDCQKLLAPSRQLEEYRVLKQQLNRMEAAAREREAAEAEAERLLRQQTWRQAG